MPFKDARLFGEQVGEETQAESGIADTDFSAFLSRRLAKARVKRNEGSEAEKKAQRQRSIANTSYSFHDRRSPCL
jgi:hypothetical protein